MQPVLHHRPGYAEGSLIPLAKARWIHAHTIVGMLSIDEEGHVVRLFASDGTSIRLHCLWGIDIHSPTAKDRSCIRLVPSVQGSLDRIAEWESAFPDEPRIGSLRRAA